jgi:hypothetical protein
MSSSPNPTTRTPALVFSAGTWDYRFTYTVPTYAAAMVSGNDDEETGNPATGVLSWAGVVAVVAISPLVPLLRASTVHVGIRGSSDTILRVSILPTLPCSPSCNPENTSRGGIACLSSQACEILGLAHCSVLYRILLCTTPYAVPSWMAKCFKAR